MRISDWSSDVCSSDLGGRGVGAMRAFGDEQHAPVLAARFERCLDAKDAAKFAMCTRLRRHGDAMHPRKRDQPFDQVVYHRVAAFHSFLQFARVVVGDSQRPSALFIYALTMILLSASQALKLV